MVLEAFTKDHVSEARDCTEKQPPVSEQGSLVLEAGSDSHLGAVGTSASVCTVQAVLTPPQPGRALRGLPTLPLLPSTAGSQPQTQQAQGDQIVPSPTAGLKDHHTGRLLPQNLVRMRMGNPEEAPKPYEGGNKIFLVWSQIGPRPSVSPSSQRCLPGWPTQGWVWHVRRL